MGDCCQNFEDILFEPEEDLSDSDSQSLKNHLDRCESCRAERELFLESWSALDELEVDLDPCPMIRARVWEQIRKEECVRAPILAPETVESVRHQVQWLAVAGVALILGFGLGRGLRTSPLEPAKLSAAQSGAPMTEAPNQEVIDPALIKLASEDGYSLEIFPESINFTPLDPAMKLALTPSKKEVRTQAQKSHSTVPVEFVSLEGAK